MKTERKTKAQRAHEAIGEVAGKIDYLHSFELLKIGQAAFPDLQEFQTRLVVYDDMIWTKGETEGNLHALSTDSTIYEFRMAKALVFFREMYREEGTSAIHHDVRLAYEFDLPINDGRPLPVRLDCETGQVWLPRSIVQLRAKWTSAERCAEIDRYEAAARAKCQAALREILTRVEFSTFWQIGDADLKAERWTEVLQLRRRKGRQFNTELVEVLASKYFPAGSALPKEEQEAFRLAYLAKQQEELAA